MDHRYRKFLALVEMGSFSAAAKKLHVTQPAITFAVASLEHAFGAKLYVRKRQPFQLTAQGEIVAQAAQKIAHEIDKMRGALHQEVPNSRYRLGVIDSVAQLLYGARQAGGLPLEVEVRVDNSRRILNSLAAGELDTGIITGQPTALAEGLVVTELPSESFVFVRALHQESDAQEVIDDWLALNQDSTTYAHFVGVFKKLGFTVRPTFYSTSLELLKEMAVAGKGTALLPRHMVQSSVVTGALTVVPTEPLKRPIWAVSRPGAASAAVGGLVTQLSQLLEGG